MSDPAESIAAQFHATYERLAPNHGYQTRKESAVPWSAVPDNNRNLMIAVVADLLDRGVIALGRDDPFQEAREAAGLEINRG